MPPAVGRGRQAPSAGASEQRIQLVDEPLRLIAGSIAKDDLRCEIDSRVLTFDDFSHLQDRLGTAPSFAGDPDTALVDALTALHHAR